MALGVSPGGRDFEPLDFEERDWVPYSGWPVTREDLDPFYERAREVLRGIELFSELAPNRSIPTGPARAPRAEIARGDSNKVWIVPSELGEALKGIGGMLGSGAAADDGPTRSV